MSEVIVISVLLVRHVIRVLVCFGQGRFLTSILDAVRLILLGLYGGDLEHGSREIECKLTSS